MVHPSSENTLMMPDASPPSKQLCQVVLPCQLVFAALCVPAQRSRQPPPRLISCNQIQFLPLQLQCASCWTACPPPLERRSQVPLTTLHTYHKRAHKRLLSARAVCGDQRYLFIHASPNLIHSSMLTLISGRVGAALAGAVGSA
jgi:hypothetical protein